MTSTLTAVRADRECPGRRPASRQGCAGGDQGGEGRGRVLNSDGTLTAGPATLVPGSTRPSWWPRTPSSRRSCLVVRDWWFSTATSQRSWRPRLGQDRIRELQDLRKSSGLDVSDRIQVLMSVPARRADWSSDAP